MDLFDFYILRRLIGGNDVGDEDVVDFDDSSGGGAIALWFGMMVAFGAVGWVFFELSNYTASNSQSVLAGLAVVAVLVVGAGRRMTFDTDEVDDWDDLFGVLCLVAVSVGVVGGLLAVIFRASVFVVPLYVHIPNSGVPMIVYSLLVIVLFLCTVASVAAATLTALALSKSSLWALFVSVPAVYGSLVWGWFLVLSHPGQLPFDNPVPGLGPLEIPLLTPFLVLFVGGIVGIAIIGPSDDNPEEERGTTG